MKFHHIGIACYDIEKTSSFYISQGYTKTETVYDSVQNVNICFLNPPCTEKKGCIELVSPKDDTSPVCKFLQKNGVSPYHICYEVKDLEETITELKKQKFIIVKKQTPAIAFGGKMICFVFSKDTGLIEFVENEEA